MVLQTNRKKEETNLLEFVIIGSENHINQQLIWIKGVCSTLGIPKPDEKLTVCNPWKKKKESTSKKHCCQHMIIPAIPESYNLEEFVCRLESMQGVFLRCPECEKRWQKIRQEFSHRQEFSTTQEFAHRQNFQAAIEAFDADHIPDDGVGGMSLWDGH